MIYLLITYCVLVGLLTLLDARLTLMQKGIVKMTSASIFVGIPAFHLPELSNFEIMVFVGLATSWLGDLCLVWSGTGTRFKLGIFSFLLAHFAYAAAFLLKPLVPQTAVILCIGFLVIAGLVYNRLRGDMPNGLKTPVRIYILALVAMTALAWSINDEVSRLSFGLAATAFLVSDISVALQRFGRHSQRHRLWGVPLYFGAQLGFALLITEQYL
jgi:uncharacterized membrane protein YhhN